MKWISPALVLALMPAGAVLGQSTTSDFDQLAPGPIAELLPDDASGSSFRPGIVQPNNVIQPPATNPLPGDGFSGGSPLTPSGSDTRTAPRGSLITEPVTNNQATQPRQNSNSYESAFTLPRTPSVSPEYIQQQPERFTPPANGTYSSEFVPPTVYQESVQTPISTTVTTEDCGCGSNGMIFENAPCETCQELSGHMELGSECSTCEEAVIEGCDSCDDCEVIGGPEAYSSTNECGFADADDVGHRDIKQGVISRHFKKHLQKKTSRRQHDDHGVQSCDVAGCDVAGCDTGRCDEGHNVYQPAVADLRNPQDTQTNSLFNVSGVYFQRNTPDFLLSAQPNPTGGIPTEFLTTGDADPDDFGGFDATFIRRRATGKGFELRYLNLSPGEATGSLGGNPFTVIGQFGQIGQIGGLTHQQAFNLAEVHEVSRDMTIQNAEFNLLRMGRQARTRRGQQATFEYLLGFRYFQFEETLAYTASGIRPNVFAGGDISRADYVSEVENDLYGAQFGGRSEISLFKRFSFLVGLKAGIFSNTFNSRQRATTTGIRGETRIAQILDGPNQGTPFNLIRRRY